MIFESKNMTLKTIRLVLSNTANDVYVCQNTATESGDLYTLILIKEHYIVHKLLKVFENSEKSIEETCVQYFSVDENFALVMPYVKERPLRKFFMGTSYDLKECEEVCVNLVINFLTSKLPYPIMYLILTQGQLNFAKDKSIYMGYQIDFMDLNESVGERSCVTECAKIVLELLESKRSETDVMTYDLINKKIERNSYSLFTELYKDIKIAATPGGERGLFARIKAYFRRNKDSLFKKLLVIAVILGLFVLASFITNILFGDIPWLRIFFGGFKYIGTENLAK